MKTRSYFIVLMLFASVILCITSCNYIKPVEGNGKFTKVDRELKDDFTSMEISGNFNVVLTQDSLPKLSIETDENLMDYIDTKVKNHKLIIKSKKRLNSAKGITIFVGITQLQQMELSGAVVLRSSGKINLDAIKIELSGASNVYMDLNCTTLNADMSGSSTLRLIGAGIDAEIEASGACDIDNSLMPVENMNLEVSGAGKIIVNVLTKLDAKVSGAAEVEYMGAPEVHKEVSGSGSVSKIF
jgi:hypothetical protein